MTTHTRAIAWPDISNEDFARRVRAGVREGECRRYDAFGRFFRTAGRNVARLGRVLTPTGVGRPAAS